jgi:hypothetical protein
VVSGSFIAVPKLTLSGRFMPRGDYKRDAAEAVVVVPSYEYQEGQTELGGERSKWRTK